MTERFSGEYFNTLDEKGRIAFPARLRSSLGTDTVWITKGLGSDLSLVIYSPEEWQHTVADLEKKLSIYNSDTRWLYRRFVSPAREAVIDKNGRIAIPQSLREYARLSKECVFLGMNTVIELWDVDTLKEEEKKASESGISIFEELGKLSSGSSAD
jgi:MraZ protein